MPCLISDFLTYMQQRRDLNDVLLRAASLEDVVQDAAGIALLAPSTDPPLCPATQFDCAPCEFTVSESIIHSLHHDFVVTCDVE